MKFLLISALFIFAKCNHHSQFVAGGPCSYDTARFKAIVIQVDTVKTRSYDTVYAVNLKLSYLHNHSTDVMPLSHMTRNELNSGFLKKHDIKVGKTLTGTAWFITSGTCNPEMYDFDEVGIGN